ncbi:phage tail tube assembly chaperone [Streptococcus ferus]|uniref:phage tail tube assembly chaperone n=1 Tax=Streptococcus ferus TaxID=1345 RepID=UPI003516307C
MKIIKLKAPKLSKKQFNVLASNRNVMDINKLQLEIAQQNAKLEEEPENATLQFETTVNVIQKTISCLTKILDLDEEQKKILEEEYDNAELFELSDFLYFRLYGLSEEDYKKLKESQSEEASEGLEGA